MEKITYKKSLSAKLILNQDSLPAYQMLKDVCNTHFKVSTRMSFGKETISYGKTKVAMIKMVVKHIHLYLALNPKDYENTKYHFKDMSLTKIGETYPMRVVIKGSRSLKYAIELLEAALYKVGANTFCIAEDVDYQKLFYPRGFDVLLGEGLIKKYVRTTDAVEEEDEFEDENEEYAIVHVTAKLLYEAEHEAESLFIVTNLSAWDPLAAIPMVYQEDGTFTAEISVPVNTHLEFKVCRSEDWKDVEKGIWKEEIINHYYYVTEDIEVEDLIYNFRQE